MKWKKLTKKNLPDEDRLILVKGEMGIIRDYYSAFCIIDGLMVIFRREDQWHHLQVDGRGDKFKWKYQKIKK